MHPPLAAVLLEKIAAGVAAAHALGIVHRDLKPANVLLSEERGTRNAERKPEDAPDTPVLHSAFRVPHSALLPKVADFGLAKRAVGAGAELTHTKDKMGTPAYMAPEQVRGAKFAGPPADVWALGVILYECLAGMRPFASTSLESLFLTILNDEPVPVRRFVPKLPRDLETVVGKCLSKEVEARYPSAKELADDLGRYNRGESILARPTGRVEQAARWVRRKPAKAAAYGVSTVAALLVFAVFIVAGLWRAAETARDDADSRRDFRLRMVKE